MTHRRTLATDDSRHSRSTGLSIFGLAGVGLLGLSTLTWGGPAAIAQPDPSVFEPIRNAEVDTAFADASQQEIIDSATGPYRGFSNDTFTQEVAQPDNGASPGQGQFRMACQYSHFAFDDPIVKPGQPGAAHLHMFWGNTSADAFSKVSDQADPADQDELMENGAGSCQGGVLNRSAYWMPALYAGGEGEGRQIVVPDTMTIYYKSYRPGDVNPLPQGIEFLAGNLDDDAKALASFDATDRLFWGCYDEFAGLVDEKLDTIPTNCRPDQKIQAVVQFPQCIAVDAAGDPVLTSDDLFSHFTTIDNNSGCPASHPYRVPQISYLISWPNLGADEVSTWRLSCDEDYRSENPPTPGGCLHADWLGGWNDDTMQAWIDGCHSGPAGSRNCSQGQTGRNGTSRSLRRISPLNDYTGDNLLDDPCPTCTMGAMDVAPTTTTVAPATTTTTTTTTTVAPATTTTPAAAPTTSAPTTVPAPGEAVALPGRIEAEDYDTASDSSAGNIGGAYRDGDVDIERSRDADRGNSVGWTSDGEYLEWTIDAGFDVRFDLTARVASAVDSPGSIEFTVDGDLVSVVDVDFTGNWYQWETVSGGRIAVPTGTSTLRATFVADDGERAAVNLNWVLLD